jgi:hypothetical protein
VQQQGSIGNTGIHQVNEANHDSANNPVFGDSVVVMDFVDPMDSLGMDSTVSLVSKVDKPTQSVFKSHSLKQQDKESLDHNYLNIDWISIHFILLLGLLAWARINYRKRLFQIVKSFIAPRYLNQMAREGNIFRERIAIPLFVIYLVSFSMLLYLLLTNYSDYHLEGYSGFKLFSIILLIVLILWFIKNILVHFIGVTFKNELVLQDFMLTNFVFNLVSGLLLLPVIAVSVYISSKGTLLAALVFWLLIFGFKIARELFTGLSYAKFSLFNRFLYLCALEILPILIFIKLVMSNLSFV